jgi:hypothetical protein
MVEFPYDEVEVVEGKLKYAVVQVIVRCEV